MNYIKLFKTYWYYTENEKYKVILFYILHILSMLGELGKPLAFALVINALQTSTTPIKSTIKGWVLYAICFFIFEVFHRSARFIERYVAYHARKRFILSAYRTLQSKPLTWHTDHHSGSIIDRVNKAANALLNFGQSQFEIIRIIMIFIGPMIILWHLSPVISIVATCSGFLLVLTTKKIYSLSVPEYRMENDKSHKVASALHDYISNITTIIMLRLGMQVSKDLDKRVDAIFPHMVKENKLTQLKCFCSGLIVLLLEIFVIFYYIYSKTSVGTSIMIGSVAALFDYTKQYMSSFLYYSGDYESYIHWYTDFQSVEPLFSDNPNTSDEISLEPFSWQSMDIELAPFSYPDSDRGLSHIKMHLKRGQKIAFVGESGSGKSTLLKLLRGIIPVDGKLVVDEQIFDSINRLSHVTTLIPQDAELFENTIEYNIAMGLNDDLDSVKKYSELACFDAVVAKLPNQYNSDVREKGVNLSGGEKQRLALARGLYAINDSSIILMDEPTSSVDVHVEQNIFSKIMDAYTDKTLIVSTHNLHLTKKFDYIYVIKDGQIVEEGTFHQLQSTNGEFSMLYSKYAIA